MATELKPGSPLDVQLPDGGRLVVAFEVDDEAAVDAEIVVIDALVAAGDAEGDTEQAIVDALHASGLEFTTSHARRPTTIVVR